MPSFAITTPKYGVGEHVPKTLLSGAFIASESRNVRQLYGDYRAARGRLPALYDANNVQIAAPKLVYEITGVTQGTKTITIAGNHATAIAAAIQGDDVRLMGSTGNDALYTLVSATDSGGDTAIVVSEALADATVDGYVFIGATRVLAYHTYVKESTGAEHLLLATAYHILLWNNTNQTLTVKFTCATPTSVERWSMATYLDCVYATNNVDKVQKWDSTTSIAGDFANVTGASGIEIATGVYLTAAKCLYSKHGYLWLGGTTETGTSYPRRTRYSDVTAATFDVDGAGDAGVKDLDDECGFVTGFSDVGNYVIIASENRITRAWLTATDTPWYFVTERIQVGCKSPQTMVHDREGKLYFLASDMTIRDLETGTAITSPQAAQTVRRLNPEVIDDARAVYYENIDRLLFAVPTAESDTNDLVIEIDASSQAIVYHDIPVAAFGSYSRQAIYTWDTLPYDTYDEWGAAWIVWDANANSVGFPLLLASDYSGYTYEYDQSDSDAGTTMDRELIYETGLMEPGKHLAMFKRISQGIDLFFARNTDTHVSVYAKTDGCRDWILLGTSSLVGDGSETRQVAVHVDADLRAKHFTIRIVADGYFEFVGMYIDDFELDGLR